MPRTHLPGYRLHKASGQAVVSLSGGAEGDWFESS